MKKTVSAKLLALLLSLLLLLSAFSSCGSEGEPEDNADFAALCSDFLVFYIEEDQYACNLFFENPSDFGLEHYDPSWYSYEDVTEEDIQTDLDNLNGFMERLNKFKPEKLNVNQRTLYNTLKRMLTYYITYESEGYFLYNLSYINQFGGYAADLADALRGYTLRNEQDVEDLITMINSAKDVFATYPNFAKARLNAGMPLTDFTLNEMIKYLDGVIEAGDDYYLNDYFEESFEKLTFLSAEKKTEYLTEIHTALRGDFMQAHVDLRDALKTYLGKNTENKTYVEMNAKTKEYYALELGNLLGFTNMDMESYIEYLETKIHDCTVAINRAVVSMQTGVDPTTAIAYALGEKAFLTGDYMTEFLPYLQTFATTMVPELPYTPEISIELMDETAAEYTNAVAYYTKSAVDARSAEHITLNPLYTDDKNDLLSTMAHEGYPGHLYNYVYVKGMNLHPLTILAGSTAYAEGWATYVQQSLYAYIKENTTSKPIKQATDYLKANDQISYLAYTYADVGIHYGIDGKFWTPEDVLSFFEELGFGLELSDAEEMYNLLAEIPTQYAAYGYGMQFFLDLHNKAKEELGDKYDEIAFNEELLCHGWVGLEDTADIVDKFIAKNK